jgi:hypothetical protein
VAGFVEVRGFEPLTPAVRRQYGARPLSVVSRLPAAQGMCLAATEYDLLSPIETTSAAFLPPLPVDPLDSVLHGAPCRVCINGWSPMLVTYMN